MSCIKLLHFQFILQMGSPMAEQDEAAERQVQNLKPVLPPRFNFSMGRFTDTIVILV
jgi:hypothetical protein